mgnify:CR=1 FL=1
MFDEVYYDYAQMLNRFGLFSMLGMKACNQEFRERWGLSDGEQDYYSHEAASHAVAVFQSAEDVYD